MTVPPPPPSQPAGEFGYPVPPPPAAQGPKLSATWTGVLIAIGGLIAAVGTFLDYEKLTISGGSYSFTGVGSETASGRIQAEFFTPGGAGKIVLGLGIVSLVLGLLILARQGRLWVSIVGIVMGAIGLLLTIAAVGVSSSDADKLSRAAGVDATGSVGIGAILGVVVTVLILVFSIVAIANRRRAT